MDREQCIDALYEEVKKEIPISRSAYGNSLYGWDVRPIQVDGKQIGVLLLNGNEIHVQLQKDGALKYMRRAIKQCVVDHLPNLGYMVTRTFDDAQVIRFLERLGFYRTGQDGQLLHYRLDELKIK